MPSLAPAVVSSLPRLWPATGPQPQLAATTQARTRRPDAVMRRRPPMGRCATWSRIVYFRRRLGARLGESNQYRAHLERDDEGTVDPEQLEHVAELQSRFSATTATRR